MPMMPHGCSTMSAHQRQEAEVKDSNKVCPVSAKKIDERTKVTYQYEGKAYNFCCGSCVEEFKKDPEKYIKKSTVIDIDSPTK
jgi:YHS domain-containing protein